MQFAVRQATLTGAVDIPGSKSHTIRGVLFASLAAGESVLEAPLSSADTEAAVAVYRGLGAEIELGEGRWRIRGIGGKLRAPSQELDVRNSGTTINVALGTCALLRSGEAILTGDHQIQRRPSGPLLKSLHDLGAQAEALRGNGCAPFRVRGTLRGGKTRIAAPSSQYVTSLLLACPLAEGDSEVEIELLHEKPYAQMTLDWLDFQGIRYERDGWRRLFLPGRQQFRPFTRKIPADFSSAAFFLAAGALPGNAVTCRGLDLADSQSDKAVVEFLRRMGAQVSVAGDAISVRAASLHGIDMDLNDCPDSLPILAVVGCFAQGTTRLLNVPQARIKETDRIAVMCRELRRLGARIEELPDGLVVQESRLCGAPVDGHGDHRVVMSLAVAGSQLAGETRIAGAEAAGVTFPTFAGLLQNLGARLDSLADNAT